MPREITKTIYTFQELLDLHKAGKATSKAIENAREWLRESATDHDWYEFTTDCWKEALAQIGFTDAKIAFSGFWSQGDGASFTANIDIEKLANFLATEITPSKTIAGTPEDFRPWLADKAGNHKATNAKYRRLVTLGYFLYPSKVERTSHNYSHERTCRVNIEFNTVGRADKVEALLNEFESDAETLRLALCRAIYKDLEEDYDSQTSDESLTEFADGNDYTFTLGGKREG
jgi:hypothetical protein